MTSNLRKNVRSFYETCQYSRFVLSNGNIDKEARLKVNVQRMCLHKITSFKMSCHAQQPSGTRVRLPFLSNRHL